MTFWKKIAHLSENSSRSSGFIASATRSIHVAHPHDTNRIESAERVQSNN